MAAFDDGLDDLAYLQSRKVGDLDDIDDMQDDDIENLNNLMSDSNTVDLSADSD